MSDINAYSQDATKGELFGQISTVLSSTSDQGKMLKVKQMRKVNVRVCLLCGFFYSSMSALINHIENYHLDYYKTCKICALSFQNKQKYNEHMSLHMLCYNRLKKNLLISFMLHAHDLNGPRQEVPRAKKLICELCGFSSSGMLGKICESCMRKRCVEANEYQESLKNTEKK
ncbi:uncharacterized protein LOC119662390 [Teleopsis dalmanni]|uniref:uncharacterized protein LOC119662390 n=1 Tax=Teleopsis dalmanni TaxID=139649 RepID=UPI000D32B878|nr:uncharacterized protein LOC119662390 [Teleopsis dalmanni]